MLYLQAFLVEHRCVRPLRTQQTSLREAGRQDSRLHLLLQFEAEVQSSGGRGYPENQEGEDGGRQRAGVKGGEESREGGEGREGEEGGDEEVVEGRGSGDALGH